MTTVTVVSSEPAPAGPARRRGAVPSLRVAAGLAPGEAWRLVKHPVFVVGFGLNVVLVSSVGDNGPRDAFDSVTTGSTFFSGVFVYFAAFLVATRTRRARSGELLGALPAGDHARTLALCLAAVAPALLNGALVLLCHLQLLERGAYLAVPTAWHLAQGPLTVLGGALLGTMVARWAPHAGVAVVVMVGMVAWNVVTDNRPEWSTLGTLMSWALWGQDPQAWVGLKEGSAAWHAVYLAVLCAMAAAGALLRAAPRPRLVLAAGAALTAAAVVAGWASLP